MIKIVWSSIVLLIFLYSINMINMIKLKFPGRTQTLAGF